MKLLTCLLLLLLGSTVSFAFDTTSNEISRIECGAIEGPVSRNKAYPIHVCRLSIPSLEVYGDAGINDFYELTLSNGIKEIWQPTTVTTAKIMCITAPCPYAIRNYTLRLIGYTSFAGKTLQVVLDDTEKLMKAGVQLSTPTKFEDLFFIRAKETYEARQLQRIEDTQD